MLMSHEFTLEGVGRQLSILAIDVAVPPLGGELAGYAEVGYQGRRVAFLDPHPCPTRQINSLTLLGRESGRVAPRM